MRVLFSSTANDGHFQPMVPFLRACADAGHEVAVAAPLGYAAAVARTGHQHLPFDDTDPALAGAVMARVPTMTFEDANRTVVREVFGRLDAQAAFPGLVDTIDSWRPDLIVREPAELGSLAAAVQAGVPSVQLVIGVQEMDRYFSAELAEPLADLEAIAGLDPGRLAAAIAAEPGLSLVPEGLDRAGDPDYREDRPMWRFSNASTHPTESAPLPVWGDPQQPLVYVTFGTVTGSLPPFRDLFARMADALGELQARVLMTVGHRVDLDSLRAVPANVRIEAWWPQSAVFPYAAAVLGHGGFGTTLGAATAGVPQVVAPLFTTDQAFNGHHVAAFGAGRSLELGQDAVPHVAAELTAVLDDPAYGAAAKRLAASIAALAPVSACVPVLERLAADRSTG